MELIPFFSNVAGGLLVLIPLLIANVFAVILFPIICAGNFRNVLNAILTLVLGVPFVVVVFGCDVGLSITFIWFIGQILHSLFGF